jgi:oligoribonuclease NrnB/cAMP/cGMP phosphodiesterase (DHH superfamily)
MFVSSPTSLAGWGIHSHIFKMNKQAIIYHEVKPGVPCPDGLAAAWVAKKAFPSAETIGVSYLDRDLLDVSDYAELVIVDFSFPSSTIEQWSAEGKNLLLIDHHKSALSDLSHLIDKVMPGHDRRIVFDMDECGATLTWKTLFPTRPMPPFLEYVKDRDIWLHKLPKTHEVFAALGAIGRSFALFDVLELMTQDALVKYLTPLGRKELENKREKVKELASRCYWDIIGGYEVPIVELTQENEYLTSDLCNYLCKKHSKAAFAAAVIDSNKISLRSDKDGLNTDVSAIAKKFGGGGHHNSSSYSTKQRY